MTVRYVGAGGNNGNSGLSWALRKATLNGVEDSPVAAGDVVYVGPGTYRETLTLDVSGSAGNLIAYIGDCSGASTDGVGGIVRITGSANETTTGTRTNAVSSSAKTYRSFRGFLMDGCSSSSIESSSAVGWVVDQCVFIVTTNAAGTPCISFTGAGQSANTVSNCVFIGRDYGIWIQHSSAIDNAGITIQGCRFMEGGGGMIGVRTTRVGGITVKNCTFSGCNYAVYSTTLTAGQLTTVNNCIICHCANGLGSDSTATFSENYNSIHATATARLTVTAGANSVTYPPGFDMMPYFKAMGGGTRVVPLLSLASYSGLVEYSAGTGAPATDIRGHAVEGSLREWGAEEYVSTYTSDGGGSALGLPIIGSAIVRGAE